MPYPTRIEGRWWASPKGGNRGAALRPQRVRWVIGDLNEDAGPGELDSGTDAGATALRGVRPVRPEPYIGDARVQERWMPGAMTMGVRVSQAR